MGNFINVVRIGLDVATKLGQLYYLKQANDHLNELKAEHAKRVKKDI